MEVPCCIFPVTYRTILMSARNIFTVHKHISYPHAMGTCSGEAPPGSTHHPSISPSLPQPRGSVYGLWDAGGEGRKGGSGALEKGQEGQYLFSGFSVEPRTSLCLLKKTYCRTGAAQANSPVLALSGSKPALVFLFTQTLEDMAATDGAQPRVMGEGERWERAKIERVKE